jgi:uncharacterized repeat protein (TIGR01451 family)
MQGNAKSFLKAVLLGFGLALLVLGTALAMTPAGTQIQNQASASYIDSAGQPRTTTSNLVVTVVQQVYSFTITPDGPNENSPGQIKTALPGGQVIFNYVVTNTGNGTDTINLSWDQGTADNFDLLSPAIYLDANCNGNLDAGETAVTSVTLGMGQQACVIVRGTIPTTASGGQYGNLNLVGTSAGGPTDTDNWARALATAQAALTASKSASPSGTVSPGDTITYTISGQNVGGSAAYGYPVTVDGTPRNGILIEDTIPTGLTVTQVSGSAGAGTVRFIYYNGTAWTELPSTTGLSLLGDGAKKVGMLIEGTGAFFPVGAGYTFSFQATVPSSAPAGTGYANFATVTFDANGDGDANDPGETVTTNTTTNTVAAAYNVAVGPYEHPTGAPAGTGPYTVGGYTVTRSGDQQTIASVYSGTTVIFRHTLENTGNTDDSFTLSVSGAPTGWACSLVADDLTTPISGPVGPVAANGTLNFALKCQVPATYTSTTPITLTVTATSVGDPSKSDTTTDVVSAVADGFRFDLYGGLTAPYDVGKMPSSPPPTDPYQDTSDGNSTTRPSIPTTTANPGASVTYRLRVENLNPNGQADNYLLLVQPVLPPPPDFYDLVDSVLFYADANDDGIPDGAPISNTGPVNFGDTFKYLAVVTLKANAAPVSVGFNFAAQSTASASEGLDWVYAQIDVNLVAQITLAPDRSGTVTSPGVIQYTHTLTNNSNTGATCTISGTGGSHGWTYQYSEDGSAWSASLSGVSVAANGGSQTIYVRVLVPAGEPIGRTDVNTVTANCTVGSVTATDTARETTTVVGGELRVTKSAVSYVGNTSTVRDATGATAYPGDVIEYTIEAENIGTGNLTNVRISDPIPAYTTFVSVSATATGFPTGSNVLYSTDGTTWSATAPASVPTGGVVYVGVDTNGDGTITNADIMPPAAKITIILKVQVQ